ncbi:hypothetical protein BGY98DRAFT_938473 [Russula aff. rugulosa BPL654]|nr:hypothetical protein BGY98DRAFT_938473 [Russula aff. rugulosa BPL654]
MDEVLDLRFSVTEGFSQSEPAEEQDPKTSVAVNPSPASFLGGRAFRLQVHLAAVGPSSSTQSGEDEDGFGKLSSDKVSCREKITHSRSESPKESFQGHEPVSHSLPSSHFTVQGTPGFGITHRSIDTSPVAIPPVISYFPYLEDVRQRRNYSPTGRNGTGFGAASPNLVTRASASAPFTSRRDASATLPSPATSSPHRSLDPGDPGTKVNQATSLTFEEE